ncbi:CBS domain-containing protein [Streptomyces sp. NPDC003863]
MSTRPFTVADLMTRKVVAVLPGAEFKEIVTAMERWRVSAVPVVEGEGRVVGIVSEGDLLLKEEFHDHRLGLVEQLRRGDATAKAGSRRAEDLMTTPAVTVAPEASLPQAARLMAAHRVKRLPVVDASGTIQGIVSRSDLLKVFLRPDEDLAAEVRADVVEPLFPLSHRQVEVRVDAGVVTLSGAVHDGGLIPLAARLTRAVEGVVDVECRLAVGPGPDGPPLRGGNGPS